MRLHIALKSDEKIHKIIGALLLAVLISFCMKDIVNWIAYQWLPECSVSIRAIANDGNRNVTIVYEGNQNELFPQLKAASDEVRTGWAYVDGEPGVRWTSLTLPPDEGEVTIIAKRSPRLCFTAFGNRAGGILELTIDGEITTQDCYMDVDDTQLLRIFPFQHSKLVIVIKVVLYTILILSIALAFNFVGYLFKKRAIKKVGLQTVLYHISNCLNKPITIFDFIICWIGLFFLALIIYKIIGIPNYLQIGDELDYWRSLILNNGKWDVAMLAGRFAPRGYWCYIPQSIAHYVGDLMSIDPSIIWMLFPSATISWMAVKVFPGIYEMIGEGDRQAKKMHTLPFLIVMITTWQECLTSVTMDLFGVVFLFAGIYYILRFFKTKKWTNVLLAGILSSVSCSFRTANLLGIVAVVLYELILIFIHVKNEAKTELKSIVVGIAIGLFSFVVICMPQLQVNIYRGHPGLFPYDHDQAWYGRSVTIWSSDYAMTTGNIAYPLLATDDQMLTMKNSSYIKDVPLSKEQLLDTYMESPMETLMLISKKLLIGFDKQTNIAYPDPGPGVPWRETSGMFFSLWNYFVLFASLYAIVKNQEVLNKERLLALLLFIFLVLPETFMKIEWRYIFAGYMMLYYFFTFHFVGQLVQSEDARVKLLEHSRFILKFVVFAFVYFTCSFTLLA